MHSQSLVITSLPEALIRLPAILPGSVRQKVNRQQVGRWRQEVSSRVEHPSHAGILPFCIFIHKFGVQGVGGGSQVRALGTKYWQTGLWKLGTWSSWPQSLVKEWPVFCTLDEVQTSNGVEIGSDMCCVGMLLLKYPWITRIYIYIYIFNLFTHWIRVYQYPNVFIGSGFRYTKHQYLGR